MPSIAFWLYRTIGEAVFGISGFELLIIAMFVLVIFGPDKLPELAKQFGKFMRMFKKAQDDMERVIKAEMYAPSLKDADKSESGATEPAESEDAAAAASSAQTAWSSTEEDDEEEEEE